MIWPVAELVSYLSRFLTLVPSTVIATGTPGGTAWGFDAEIGGTRAQPGVPAPYVTSGQQLRGEIGLDGAGVDERDLERLVVAVLDLVGFLGGRAVQALVVGQELLVVVLPGV